MKQIYILMVIFSESFFFIFIKFYKIMTFLCRLKECEFFIYEFFIFLDISFLI